MSSGTSKGSGALNVERRTWDKEYYEKKAKERLEEGEGGEKKVGIVRKREEFAAAEEGAAGPEGSKRAFLKARVNDLALKDKVGKIQVISGAAASQQQGGYFCDVCQCLLKDSLTYLDHINGKKHQRALGFSMRVERVGVDKVRERMEAQKRMAEESSNKAKTSAIKQYEDKLKQNEEEHEAWKEKRKEEREAKKKAEVAAAGDEEGGMDPEMAAMMGFGAFGGKK